MIKKDSLLSVVLLVVILIILNGCQGQLEDKKTPQKELTEQEVSAEDLQDTYYINTKGAFKIRLPKDWVFKYDSFEMVLLESTHGDSKDGKLFYPWFEITYHSLDIYKAHGLNPTLNDIVKAQTSTSSNDIPNYLAQTQQNLIINGQPAILGESTYSYAYKTEYHGSWKFHQAELTTLANNKIYSVSVSVLDDYWNQHKDVLLASLKTFMPLDAAGMQDKDVQAVIQKEQADLAAKHVIDADIQKFVDDTHFTTVTDLAIDIDTPEQNLKTFVVAYKHDSKGGQLIGAVTGLKHNGKIGYTSQYKKAGLIQQKLYHFDSTDDYIFTQDFFGKLDKGVAQEYFAKFAAQDSGTTESQLLFVAKTTRPPVEQLLANPKANTNKEILNLLKTYVQSWPDSTNKQNQLNKINSLLK